MYTLVIAALIMCCSLSSNSMGQSLITSTNPQAVVVPEEIYLPIRVPQPDSPLRFEKFVIVKYLDLKEEEFYELRNLSQKTYSILHICSSDRYEP